MKAILILLFSTGIALNGCSQSNPRTFEEKTSRPIVGGPCEGCEAIMESPEPFDQLNAIDTLPGFDGPGPKLTIYGTVYRPDGKTPAKDVVLYIYHTDQEGKYPIPASATGWEKRHGSIRGWVKTDAQGSYRFYTLVPASYPNSNNPKHIHPVIKEPGLNAYWIDEFLFEDDPYLSDKEKNNAHPRGGNGVLKPYEKGGIRQARRNIVLGLNIPGYPITK